MRGKCTGLGTVRVADLNDQQAGKAGRLGTDGGTEGRLQLLQPPGLSGVCLALVQVRNNAIGSLELGQYRLQVF